MDSIIKIVYSGTQFMYKEIYANDFFFIDYWTINHIWSGAFLFLILSAANAKYKWAIFSGLILSWEIVEILFRILALNAFKPEIIKDQVIDLIIGILAGIACYLYLRYKSILTNKVKFSFIAGIASAYTVSFVFLGIQISNQFNSFDYEVFNKLLYFLFTPLLLASVYLYRKLMNCGFSLITSLLAAVMIFAPGILLSCTITNTALFNLSQIYIYALLSILSILFLSLIHI